MPPREEPSCEVARAVPRRLSNQCTTSVDEPVLESVCDAKATSVPKYAAICHKAVAREMPSSAKPAASAPAVTSTRSWPRPIKRPTMGAHTMPATPPTTCTTMIGARSPPVNSAANDVSITEKP
jgi:hypothetical protein